MRIAEAKNVVLSVLTSVFTLRFFALQFAEFCHELIGRFFPLWMRIYAIDRADDHALWLVVMSYTFRTFFWVDNINLGAHINRIVRALRFTHIAIDAFLINGKCHSYALLLSCCLRAATFSINQRSTEGNTNLLTSPPSKAISRTKVPEIN